MLKHTFVLFSLFALLVSFAVAQNTEQTFDVSETCTILVKTVAGNISLIGWSNTDSVLVKATVSGENVEPFMEQNGDQITVREEFIEKNFHNSGCVHYEIYVPFNALVEGKSVSGDITSQDLTSDVEFKTVSGNIDATIDIPGHISLKSVSGDITCNITHEFSSELIVSNVSGDINISLPESADARFSGKSLSGKLECSLVMDEKTVKEGSVSKKISGVLGNGRGQITTSTISGDVTVR